MRTIESDHDAGGPASSLPVVAGYLTDLADLLERIDPAAASAAVDRIAEAVRSGRRVFVAGNGGSAATASHMANDLNASGQAACLAGQAICLNDSVSALTAIGNDHGYDEVFAVQLQRLAASDDLLVLLSVSGDSLNIVRAATSARELGLGVVGLLGQPGALADLSDITFVAHSPDYGLVEDLHLAVNHMLCRAVRGISSHSCTRADAMIEVS